MVPVNLRISASIDDIGLYAGHLYVFRRDGVLDVYSWTEAIHESVNGDASLWEIAEIAFLDNRFLKRGSPILEATGLSERLLLGAKAFNDAEITLNLGDLAPVASTKLPMNFVRDCAFYNWSIFVTGAAGTFEIQILRTGESESPELAAPSLIHDVSGLALRAKFAALSVSAGHDGFLCMPLMFDDGLPSREGAFFLDDLPSKRSSWMDEDLLTFQVDGSMSFIDNDLSEFSSFGYEGERAYISRFGSGVYRDVLDVHDLTAAFASNRRVYAFSRSGRMVVASRRGEEPEFGPPKDFPFNQRVYDGFSMSQGLIADAETGTLFFAGNSLDPTILHPGPNVVVRSFNNSKIYTHLVASVKEGHASISCLWPTRP